MTSADFQNLLDQAAGLRQEIFGRDEEGEGQTFDYDETTKDVPGYYTPIRYQRQLDELNMREVHDVVIRIRKTNLPSPAIGKSLRFLDKGQMMLVRIDELGSHPINPEWVLGCKAL